MSTYRTPTPAELARAGAARDAWLDAGDRASREIVARFWWRYSGVSPEFQRCNRKGKA